VVGINALCNAAYVLMDVVFNKLLGEAGTVEEGMRPPTQQQDKQQQRQQHQEQLPSPSSARVQELSLQTLMDSGFGRNIPQAVRDLCAEGPKAYNRGLHTVQVGCAHGPGSANAAMQHAVCLKGAEAPGD